MNYSTLSFLTSDEVIGINCVFQGKSNLDVAYPKGIDDGLRSKAYLKRKKYTYKTTDKSIKVGDLVVVQCEGESKNYGYAIVEVVETNVEIDFNTEISYKWIVNKVEAEKLELTIKAEEALIDKVKRVEKIAKKQQLLLALGLSGVTDLKLSDFSKTVNAAKEEYNIAIPVEEK